MISTKSTLLISPRFPLFLYVSLYVELVHANRGSVHVCEPHTHTIRAPITHWRVYWSSYNVLCVWASHTYYKRL